MRYRRNYIAGGTYLFTVNILDRNATLLVDYIEEFREAVRHVKRAHPFKIDAWVVMPDHMHAVWTLPESDTAYSSRWREIKKRFSKSLAKTEDLSVLRESKGERGLWQRRFWEHTIRDEKDYQHHIDYVHFNPLKHGLVSRVIDWPYSSFHRALAAGQYSEHWCGESFNYDVQGDFGERNDAQP